MHMYVVCVYVCDVWIKAEESLYEFQAVYHYTRSIYALRPFAAREKLQSLCENNRLRYISLSLCLSLVLSLPVFLR